MEVFVSFLYFIAICVAVGVVGVYWRNHPGPVWFVYLASLGVTIYVMNTGDESFVATAGIGVFFFLTFTMFMVAIVMILEDVGKFGRKLTQGRSDNLHQHHDLGWHDHPYERNHAHYGNHLSGPFYYIDERVIDQR